MFAILSFLTESPIWNTRFLTNFKDWKSPLQKLGDKGLRLPMGLSKSGLISGVLNIEYTRVVQKVRRILL